MPQFSTNAAVSLEKHVEIKTKPIESKLEDIDYVYEITKCVEWIKSNQFQKVCLQFPDVLLPDASEVALKLQSILEQTIYVLGDTAYESCCIDYIAAAHINADAIIHFGPICFSKTSANIPYLSIYDKHELEIGKLITKNQITILVDSPYIHRIDELLSAFGSYSNVHIQTIDEDPLIIKSKLIVFIGDNKRKLINIELIYKPQHLYYFNSTNIGIFEAQSIILKRRNFIIEKIKDSQTIGIIIGTLGVKNYLQIIERLKKIITGSGKKYYLISVGKPTVAKLANFTEIDIYVMVTCSLSEIYESRDFYKPIATPYDVEVALNSQRDGIINFSFDFNTYMNENFDCDIRSTPIEPDVSLLTNTIRAQSTEEGDGRSSVTEEGSILALRTDGTVAMNSHFGAGYLANRSWKGLVQDVESQSPELAQRGRTGIAERYNTEPNE
ncbi:hypothetical protein NQ317_017319 [Molorchus minor]|uniref:2-(3-amino-3-carboxypropyl)histidine synthase n=1 Tax=Molorchus minor TaxID=1323400 RepID=A0ABQ9K3M3_9CUCU|nr:hypothetical protein NQ317_017319 [Molorchus minor]